VTQAARRWDLVVGQGFPTSHVSFVAPAARSDGTPVVLKVQWPHSECVHEADALARWDGDGAVRLLEHDRATGALVLERCVPGTPLSTVDSQVALDVLTGLLPRLWRPAGAPFTSLADEARHWADGLAARTGREPLVDSAVALLRELADGQTESVLLHQDLHGDNVLRARREPWLAIDPKPLAGEREFAVAPIVRSSELGDTRAEVWYRLDRLTAELGLDRERARRWTVGQTVAWAFDDDGGASDWHLTVAGWLLDDRPAARR
jgi:streptomycin 6-kinase